MSSVVNTLTEMGFTKERAELAVSRTGSDDVQVAMDWLLSHDADIECPEPAPTPIEAAPTPVEAAPTPVEAAPTPVEAASTPVEADPTPVEAAPNVNESGSTGDKVPMESPEGTPKSIQCDDCGKLFKTTEEVEFHASKSGHENFSESSEEKKPLSETEKKEQLAKIEAKLRQRRLEREAREKEEALLKEKIRIKSGKELLEAKKKHDELEMKKIVEQRKREKEEERLARQRVKEQIEQDRLARKAKFGGGSSNTEVTSPPLSKPAISKPSTISYSEVKLQIRLPNGVALTQTFGAKEPLSAVRLYIEMHRKDADGPFNLMTNFPKKVFVSDDYDKPLETLGLAPTATLFVQKS